MLSPDTHMYYILVVVPTLARMIATGTVNMTGYRDRYDAIARHTHVLHTSSSTYPG